MDDEKNLAKRIINIRIIKNAILNFIKNHTLAFLSFMCTTIALAFYGIGYLFSYGFYFSGVKPGLDSLHDILIKPVPFDFKPILMIGIVFLVIVSLFLLILKSMEKDFFITLLIWVGIHFLIATFFIGFVGVKPIYYIIFAFIWVLPLIIYGMIQYFKIAADSTVLIISGLCYSILVVWMISIISKIIKIDTRLSSWGCLLFISIFLYTPQLLKRVITRGKSQKIYYLILYPISSSILLILVGVIRVSLKMKLLGIYSLLLQGVALFLAFIILIIFKKPLLKCIEKKLTMSNLNHENLNNDIILAFINLYKNKYLTSIVLLTSVLFSIFMISYGALIFGQSMRLAIPNTPMELIKYNFAGMTNEIVGKVVAKGDDTYYISNNKFNPVIIKAGELETIKISSFKDIFDDNERYKWIENTDIWDFSFFQFDNDPELEIMINKGQNLLLIDRDYSGVTSFIGLDGIRIADVKDKVIKVSRRIFNKGKEKDISESYKLDNKKFIKIS